MKKQLVFLIAGIFSFNVVVCAQSHQKTIDSFLHTLYPRYEIAGNTIVAQKGAVLLSSSLGYANATTQQMLTARTAFQLASVSKIFTSLAILQLKDRGKVKLDEPLKTYLPAFKYGNITIRHLLSHTSGLADFQMLEEAYAADTGKIFTIADLVPAINNSAKSILFQPGEKWSYSNSGYGLLALVVAQVTGISFSEYLEKYIFRPAGMKHTYVNTSLHPVSDPFRAIGYDYPAYAPWILQRADSLSQNRIECYNLGGLVGHSNVISTATDLLRFDRALYSGKLIKQSTLQEAFTPARLNNHELAITGWNNNVSYYGLGWRILVDSTYGKVVFHGGGMAGAVTLFLRNITKDQTVILLNNVTHRETHTVGVNIYQLLNGGAVYMEKESLARLYARSLIKLKPDTALAHFNIYKRDTAHYYMSERELNMLGLQMFYNGYKKEGAAVLQLNMFLYPQSANVFDSYGTVLKGIGNNEEAVLMFRQALNIDATNKHARQMIEELTSDKK